ncbi:MAG TPA: hypothetical protein VG323_10625, partial [Thermoanaerobaculia bacterium]|nr:hypothetical protein [Thermoanaerobaculia bacterium]
MRLGAAVVSLLLVCIPAAAQHFHQHADPSSAEQFRRSPCDKKYATPPRDPDLQKVQWKAIHGSDIAREYFSQGMTLYYGFNFEAAERNFRAALEKDDTMAMAAWGIALASGPNINISNEGACASQARDLSKLAVDLAKTQPGIGDLERELITALR